MSTAEVVMITGAAGNLGRALAERFDAKGASLVLLDVNGAALSSAYGKDDARHLRLPTDLNNDASVGRTVTAALERFGRIDTLCNIAGGFDMGPAVHETGDALWQAMLDLNAGTLLGTVRAVVPHMLKAGRGQIVNVGAGSAVAGRPNMGAYCASKSAVVRLTESMSAELRDRGIRVNCVLPSILDTPANRGAMPDADPKRWVAPADLAQVIAFLCSDAARAIHGAAIPVFGLSPP
jgi:NAD(P)-dependent dehydrogenase (short-subunit alcohol dehydrogenase family)